ncbi:MULTISPECIES: FAD-dependent monooxygenase [unclassified Streptosporangium]|uniref:FAD-dependent monooxygenase n=1 Tax=unclassified Streptosporangium TaxID=2632669 RepID=UPI003FA3C22D
MKQHEGGDAAHLHSSAGGQGMNAGIRERHAPAQALTIALSGGQADLGRHTAESEAGPPGESAGEGGVCRWNGVSRRGRRDQRKATRTATRKAEWSIGRAFRGALEMRKAGFAKSEPRLPVKQVQPRGLCVRRRGPARPAGLSGPG